MIKEELEIILDKFILDVTKLGYFVEGDDIKNGLYLIIKVEDPKKVTIKNIPSENYSHSQK